MVGGLVTTAAPAAACSCAGPPPAASAAVARADGAFVGTLVAIDDPDAGSDVSSGGRTVFNRFAVETVAKGDIGAEIVVASAADGAACGLGVALDERAGVLVTRKGDGWASGLCSKVDPDELAAISVLPRTGTASELPRNLAVALLFGGAVVAFVVRAEARHDPESPKQSGS